MRLLVTLALAACHAPTPVPPRVLARAALPAIAPGAAIVEVGDTTFAIAPTEIAILRNDVALARVALEHRIAVGAVGAIPAPTGEGRWAVAVVDGVLDHVTTTGELEPIGDRIGLESPPRAIASAGRTFAMLERDAIAVSTDGRHVERYPVVAADAIAVSPHHLAAAFADRVELWDLAAGTMVQFPIARARIGFVDERLIATSGATVFVQGPTVLAKLAAPAAITALATAGSRAWIWAGDRLYALDGAHLIATDARGAAPLTASATGAVWTLGSSIARVSLEHPIDQAWQREVAPVFARVCSHCHLPGGDAGIDLSTAAAWIADRGELRNRVLETQTMPPAGTELTAADRAAIERWLAEQQR